MSARSFALLSLCVCSACADDEPKPPPPGVAVSYSLSDLRCSLTFYPEIGPEEVPRIEAGERDAITICGEELVSLRVPRLRVWASDAQAAIDMLELGNESLALAERLLESRALDLTLIAANEHPDPAQCDLSSFAREPWTTLIALPSRAAIRGAMLSIVRDGCDRFGVRDPARAMVVAAFAHDATFDAMGRANARGVLLHEVGHLALGALWAERTGRVGATHDAALGGSYGTPLADWLDEVVATAFEPADLAHEEEFDRCGLHARGIPLALFFAMQHPGHGAIAPTAERTASGVPVRAWFQARWRGSLSTDSEDVLRRASEVQADDDESRPIPPAIERAFYPQARAFGAYVLARGGPPLLRALVDDALDGLDIARSLAAGRCAGFLPPTIEALQSDWESWLAE